MIAQLILGGVILAALGGAFWSWRDDIGDQREAKIAAEMDRLQKARDLENLALAQQGIEDRDLLLKEADKRTKAAWAKASADAKSRKAQSDERAKEDLGYALWREQPLPAYSVERLRNAVILGLATDSGELSSGASVQTAPVVSAPAINERGVGRIRAFIDRATSSRMEGRGTSGK